MRLAPISDVCCLALDILFFHLCLSSFFCVNFVHSHCYDSHLQSHGVSCLCVSSLLSMLLFLHLMSEFDAFHSTILFVCLQTFTQWTFLLFNCPIFTLHSNCLRVRTAHSLHFSLFFSSFSLSFST